MLKATLLSLMSILLTACSSPLPTYYYQLDATLKTSPKTPVKTTQSQVIGIGPTILPSLLNRKAIVTRSAEQTIQITTTQQWAEPLLENIPRVIARNLATLAPNKLFHLYPWAAFGAVDQRIIIEILQFDAQLGQSVIFEAVWSIKDEAKQSIIKQSRTKLEQRLTTANYTEMVSAMNDLLGQFSLTLSEALINYSGMK